MNSTPSRYLLMGALIFLSFIFGASSNYLINEHPITRDMVQQAAYLVGLQFTHTEIDSMLPDLEEQRNDFVNIRELSIDNSLLPALTFNPLPHNFTIPTDQTEQRFGDLPELSLPDNLADIAHYSVAQLSTLLHSHQISSVELTEFYLERLKKYDPLLHCVITLTEERALAQAKRMDEELAKGQTRGLLHGIPFGVKDLLSTKDYKTTWGAAPYQDQQLTEDATVIQKLEAAGGVMVAKLSLGALAWGDVWFGERTRNPWNPEMGSSGSSAGSASAVSAGLVPFAIGTETLGSIVSPSTVCGTTGLRPTFGRVSRHGAMALSWSMDKIGPICRTAQDCAFVLEAIRGKDRKDPSTFDAPFNFDIETDLSKIKIGYVKSDFEKDYPFKKQDSLSLLALKKSGVELIPVELPKMPNIGFILEAEAAAAFDDITRNNRDDELTRQVRRAWPNVFRKARFIPAVEYINANRLRSQLIEDMDKAIAAVDVYLTPSWASSNLRITNLTGHPCVVLPNGFREGLPTSITLNGKLFDESTLLRVATHFQEITDFHQQHPELD